MPRSNDADTIRILISTDNHVGYMERDAVRSDDGWRTFDEVMQIAKDRDVDMVLLAGDLFHDNKPSRKSMYEVMRSIRMNSLGDKPCELEMLSDASEVFGGALNHVNYEDENLNVAIPVFTIHGNHDDPSGQGDKAAVDLLHIGGLLNYYGRASENDTIQIKPILLQKGRTKLALYGLSNVRDERLFRTFRDGKVQFFQPNTQQSEWFNLLSVHQNHHAYTETGYLPETFLPSFMDLIVWGHEHECLIDPTYNPEMTFHVMQPGSSIATSLMPGEAVPKHVAIVSVTGKEFKSESIRLKSVRPFMMKEIVLQDDKRMRDIALKENNRSDVTQYLKKIVDSMIEEANRSWHDLHQDEEGFVDEPPVPLIRLRVEFTAPEGGRYDIENPQRFSNRFVKKVANVNDVVQFHRKKKAPQRHTKVEAELPEQSVMDALSLDTVKVDKLVKEYLAAQNLTILPQNTFSDAVIQFIDKDDKHAVDQFLRESLKSQVDHLLKANNDEEDDIVEAMDQHRARMEQLFEQDPAKRSTKKKAVPRSRPDDWDSDVEGGPWEESGQASVAGDGTPIVSEVDMDDIEIVQPRTTTTSKTKGKTSGTATRAPRATAAAKKTPAPKATSSRARKTVFDEDDDDEEDDFVVVDHDDDDQGEAEESQGLFVSAKPSAGRKAASKVPPKRTASPPKRKTPARSSAPKSTGKQSILNFSQSQQPTQTRQANNSRSRRVQEPSDDEIDDDDAFETAPSATRTSRARR